MGLYPGKTTRVVAQTSTLPKSDKKQLRNNERALKLLGMKPTNDVYLDRTISQAEQAK